jgi:hypothetical protein
MRAPRTVASSAFHVRLTLTSPSAAVLKCSWLSNSPLRERLTLTPLRAMTTSPSVSRTSTPWSVGPSTLNPSFEATTR